MQLPEMELRPNENNANVLKAVKFLEQANIILDRHILTKEQVANICGKMEKMCQEVKRVYTLEKKHNANCDKLVERLKIISEESNKLLEDKQCLAEVSLEIEEYKAKVQKEYNDIRQLTSSAQRMKIETQHERQRNEQRKSSTANAIKELEEMSISIKNNLENSSEVGQLRKMEEEKRRNEEIVNKLQIQQKEMEGNIRKMRATVKAETKQSFKKMVIECAKHYRIYNSLIPRLERSKKNVENLKAEEAARKANGSLDETVLFDHSFVHASMEGSQPKEPKESECSKKVADQNNSKLAVEAIPEYASSNHSDQSSRDNSLSNSGSDIQNVTLFEAPAIVVNSNSNSEVRDQEMNKEPDEEEEEERDDDATNKDIDEHREIADGNETIRDSQEIDILNSDQEKEAEPVASQEYDDDEKDRSMEVLRDELEVAEEQNEPMETNQDYETSLNMSNGSGGLKSQSFFDQLLSKKGKNEKKSGEEAMLDISMNSNDGVDLLKDVENRIEDDMVSQGSSNNFSFNIFGAGTNANDSVSGNLDFNFGGSSDDNNGFDFLSGGTGDGATTTDLFNFGSGDDKNDNNPFGFNFDSEQNDEGGSGGTSFFKF